MNPKHTIGIITYGFSSHYHTPLFHTMLAKAGQRGYRLLAITATPGEVATDRIAFDQVDGWIVLNTDQGIEHLCKSEKPMILVGGVYAGIPCVIPDNRSGTTAAISHLIAEGRTRIAFVMYAINPDFRERYEAYCTTLAQHGIALDPELVLDTQSYSVFDTRQAVQRMIATGQHFDAVFCANDWLAFGAMQALQDANLRIPEDVAVIGFDDIPEASFATPPLTSVRQNAIELGQVAMELLLDQVEHGIALPQSTIIPTALIIRQSSMGKQSPQALPVLAETQSGLDWQAQLARNLVQLTITPVQLTPDTPAEQIWPGIEALVEDFAAMLEGRPATVEVPADVWERGQQLSGGGEPLTRLVELLRQMAVKRIDAADHDLLERLTRWLSACHQSVMQQQLATNNILAESDRHIFASESQLIEQIGRMDVNPRMIDWIAPSHADWAALGLWHDSPATPAGALLDISSIYMRETGAVASDLQIPPEHFPPIELFSTALPDSLQYILKMSPLSSINRKWGYLVYAERLTWTFNDIALQRNAYVTTALEREQLLNSLQDRQQVLQAAFDRERALADTIRELGCPTIPLLKDVLLVPLIGAIDGSRASLIMERVLEAVAHEQARCVLLDLTGVSLVDTQVAAAVIQTAQAVGLLGAKMTIVGVRPEIAQSIVGLGIDLKMFETHSVLSSALADLLRRE